MGYTISEQSIIGFSMRIGLTMMKNIQTINARRVDFDRQRLPETAFAGDRKRVTPRRQAS